MNPESHQLPTPLRPGDGVLLAAPARFVTQEQVERAAAWVEAAGFTPVVPAKLTARSGQFGGEDAHRAAVLNGGFNDPKIRAIWAMRGGYGCGRVLPLLDAAAFRRDPKWIAGFSDVTALHGWAQCQGVASLHGPVANTFGHGTDADRERFWRLMSESNPGDAANEAPPVLGGNLSVIYSLLGTPYVPTWDGAWLLLEDLDEYLYHIDRMLLSLRLAGVLDRAQGLLVGSFDDLHDNTQAHGQSIDNPFGQTLEEIVLHHWPAHKPIVWNVPVGHGARNEAIVLGRGSLRIDAWAGGI